MTHSHESRRSPSLLCEVDGCTIAIDRSIVLAVESLDRAVPAEGEWPIIARLGDVPVFTIPGLAGEAEPANLPTFGRVLLVPGASGRFGLRVEHVHPLVASDLIFLPMPSILGSELFPRLLRTGDRLVPVLDSAGLGVNVPGTPGPDLRARPRRTTSTSTRLLLLPMEDGFTLGLPERQVQDILDGDSSVPIPGSPPGITGVRLWQDLALPILDLRVRLGFEPAMERQRAITLVVNLPDSDEVVGLRVASRCQAVKLPIPHMRSTHPTHGDNPCFHSVIDTNHGTIGLLDLTAISTTLALV